MNIRRKRFIAGEPVLRIRELLSQYGERLRLTHLQQYLFIGRERAQSIATELERDGYITHFGNAGDDALWKASAKGREPVEATAPKPFSRKTADGMLAHFMDMVRSVNQSHFHLYRVQQVVLLGDYLGPARRLRSLDIAVYVQPKFADPAELLAQRHAIIDFIASDEGKSLSEAELLMWPERELWDTLQGDDPRISLYRMNFPFDILTVE